MKRESLEEALEELEKLRIALKRFNLKELKYDLEHLIPGFLMRERLTSTECCPPNFYTRGVRDKEIAKQNENLSMHQELLFDIKECINQLDSSLRRFNFSDRGIWE